MSEDLYEKALDAIREVFNDTTKPVSETKIDLRILIDEINTMISTLVED